MSTEGRLLWHYLFRGAESRPDHPALVLDGDAPTYGRLADTASRLATLWSSETIGRGPVGIFLPKSTEAVCAMAGTNAAGGCYVPIDPRQPPERAAMILADCEAPALVTSAGLLRALEPLLPTLPHLRTVVLVDAADGNAPEGLALHEWSELDGIDPRPGSWRSAVDSDPAYLLFTSGSTGRPKGVALSHRHAVGFVDWAVEAFGLHGDDVLSNHAPFHFDLSVLDLYGAFAARASVAPVPNRAGLFAASLAKWISESGITVWYSVPSALIPLQEGGHFEGHDYARWRTVLYAGERFPVKHLRALMTSLRHVDFFNLYGPTETNVCTYHPVPRPLPEDLAEVPIGRACANTDVFALTDSGQIAGAGERGELCVRGAAVMLGYWNRPEETARSLVPNPLPSPYPELVYRTGDVVEHAGDGLFLFVGRRDHMVKVRGYRIELGEVEHAVHRHPAVLEAAVVVVPDGDGQDRLAAGVVPSADEAPSTTELKDHCLGILPRYAVPDLFEVLPDLPRTSSGKVDRGSLTESLSNAS